MAKRSAIIVGRVARAIVEKPESSDCELLRRFTDDGDQAAFAAIVHRHAAMVLGVCRRTLANTADAEDACQATFLVLAKKAETLRWQLSVGNWLYATARRVARNARVAAERRIRREGRAAVPEAVSPLDQISGREFLLLLDEELDRLAPCYREALVLCYLEGLTRDEAAARLGVSRAALKSRLERGRQRLGAALTRRGVALGAGLLACVATSSAGASPLKLIEAIRATVAGNIPPTVAVLAKGVAVNGILKKLLLATVLGVATAAIGFGLGEPGTSSAQPKPVNPVAAKSAKRDEPHPPIDKAKREQSIPVNGVVRDPDGKPVAGAQFAVIADEIVEPIGDVKSNAEGKFAFPLSHPRMVQNPRQVVATAPGFGLDWIAEPRNDAVFHLVPDLPIAGRVIDLQGKPVAGAAVALHNVHSGTPEAFEAFVKNWKKSKSEQDEVAGKLERSIWNRGGLALAIRTKTGADGTFRLNGCGKDRVVTLLISGDGIADTFVDVVTRNGFDASGAPKTPMRLMPPKFDVVVDPDKPIIGVVRDEATKKPLAGVRVIGAAKIGKIFFGAYHFHTWPTPFATTDAAGKFALRGLAKAKAYILVADPDEGTEHLQRFVEIPDTSTGFDPIEYGINLPRGIVLTGRVTDAATGAGVPSRVFYRPLLINDLLDNFGGYDPPDYPAPWHRGRDTKTDMEGRYKITVMPGAGVVHFQAYGGSYERAKATQKEIDDGIIDKQFGHFRTTGQGGMYNPEYMNAYRIIRPKASDQMSSQEVKLIPTKLTN